MRVPLLLGAQPLVTPPTRISLGSGIPLDLAIGDGGVQGVAGGPVWTGGVKWTPDGVGYWQCDAAFPAVEPYEVLVQMTIGGSLFYAFSTVTGTVSRLTALQGYTSYRQSRVKHSGSTSIINDPGGAIAGGNYSLFPSFVLSGASQVPAISRDAATPTVGGTTITRINTDVTLLFGAQRTESGSWVYSTSVSPMWSATIWTRSLTPSERTAMCAPGQPSPVAIAPTGAWGSWDMANADATHCPDIVLGDGTRDLSAINMTPALSAAVFS